MTSKYKKPYNMDASGFLVYPFCFSGLLISGVLAQVTVFILDKRKIFAVLSEEQVFLLKVAIFVIALIISYLAIAYIFRDLYVM